jgi:hypothetical protein
MHPIEFVKHNPVVGGLGVFAFGLAVLYFLGFFKSSSGATSGADAYYAATVADAQSGDALQAAYVNAAATTAQTQIAADAYTTTQTAWANTQQNINDSNNSTAVTLAPYASQAALISGLTEISGQTETVAKKSNGFFGIGGGSKVTTTPTPLASSASDALSSLLHDMELNTVH